VNALRELTWLFGIAATTTIIDYFAYLRDSYVVDFVPRFDYSLKAQNRNPKKVYAIDLGVFLQIKNTFTEDVGRQLENAVYLHLRRKHKEIFYFNKNGECDFVVFNKGKALQCIQVCHKVNYMNMERELKGLENAMEFFGMTEGVIVTHDQTDVFDIEGYAIELIPAWKFLTQASAY
jgi:predicted AAA+ superfamily ATPase